MRSVQLFLAAKTKWSTACIQELHAVWIRACLIMLGSFLLSLAVFPAVVLLPSLGGVESEGVGRLAVLGHRHRRMGGLGLSCCCASVIIPTAVLHPCLYGCSHLDQSWLFITPISAPLGSHFRFRRKPFRSSVSHPPRCIFLL